jgi:hypothetical protein
MCLAFSWASVLTPSRASSSGIRICSRTSQGQRRWIWRTSPARCRVWASAEAAKKAAAKEEGSSDEESSDEESPDGESEEEKPGGVGGDGGGAAAAAEGGGGDGGAKEKHPPCDGCGYLRAKCICPL